MHLDVVVEIDVDVAARERRRGSVASQARAARLAPAGPRADLARPRVERAIGVAALVKLHVAVQPYINEVRGDVLEQRPLASRVRDYQRDLVLAQQRDEFRLRKAHVPYLDCVAYTPSRVDR